MKKSLIPTALIVASLAVGPTFAQDQHHPGGPGGGGAPHPGAGAPHGAPGGPGGGMGGMPGMGGGSRTMGGGNSHAVTSGGPSAPRVSGRHTHRPGPTTPSTSTGGRNGGAPGAGGHFAYQGQSHARIQAPSFHYPSGYHYRRWGAGQILPRLFLTSTFFFTDYAAYGFGPPPFGDAWVRYGPDLLLVNIASGQIVDVIYGAFY
jgi:Ni/Co efflux regulator RcnB